MPSSRPASLERGLLESLSAPRRGPLVMGIVNATPDSFYAVSRSETAKDAVEAALRMVQEGADILDVGGQSTRPGSSPVSADEELGRVVPVISALAKEIAVPISIDTEKAVVARACLQAGARILNDVSALRNDAGMIDVAKEFEAVILMHRGGENSRTMQDHPSYSDVVREVKEFLLERKKFFTRSGGSPERVWLDPGIGFGKNLDHNLSLLKHLDEFCALGPVVLGASRKTFLGQIMAGEDQGLPGPDLRLEGSLAAACWASLSGAKVLRVHDVAATRRALAVVEAVREAA